ncbi:DUF4974 domain-containing protein [Pedobacter sp. KBS0701]|uniref:FecR family protein n=1 Tax=Pedobacter sp. KBS0701 TaxID=2578106 RepID=UPI00110D7088|nr:FecR family protein [Pedobacter sp. KBS0701]QDW27254.1 DUF4974 domain-containing protein [Pedobacter sp. KBS0701]
MKDASKLLEKLKNGTATPKERELLDRWLHELGGNEPVTYSEDEYEQIMARGREALKPYLQQEQQEKKTRLWPKIAVAASIALAIATGGYFYQQNRNKTEQQFAMNDIEPGRTAATLTLSSGKKIYIADARSGKVAEESGVTITKNEKGELVYVISEGKNEPGKIQTLTTYLGETQALVLPDGSKVWLNALSSLKYPTSFASSKNRNVELTGEGYFEIAKDREHPFIVSTDRQSVEVLGTHFNINTYSDEPAVRTTLLEGSVKVSLAGGPSRVLKPGEQSQVSPSQKISVSEVDTDDIIAWKEGFFVFEDENLVDVMRQLSRWYKVEVEYSSEALKFNKFSGSISRYSKASQVLGKLGKTGSVSFRLEGKKIIVENRSKQ